jgi:hypothetical protein
MFELEDSLLKPLDFLQGLKNQQQNANVKTTPVDYKGPNRRGSKVAAQMFSMVKFNVILM